MNAVVNVQTGVFAVFAATFMLLRAERIPFDADWEFALKDFWVQYGKVGLTEPKDNMNDNGTPRVRADTDGWRSVTLPHDWAIALPYSSQGTRHGYRAVGRAHPENNIGWYRKTFTVPSDAAAERISVPKLPGS